MTRTNPHSVRRLRQRAPRTAARGFTLIEIMLVVGIMGIVLAMGLPAIVRTLERKPLQQAVIDVVEALGHARAQAILRGRPCEMVIQGDGQVFVQMPPNGRSAALGDELSGVAPEPAKDDAERPDAMFQAQLGEDIRITSVRVNLGLNLVERTDEGQARIRFFPNGTAEDFELVLEDSTGFRRITLDPVTGYSDVETEP